MTRLTLPLEPSDMIGNTTLRDELRSFSRRYVSMNEILALIDEYELIQRGQFLDTRYFYDYCKKLDSIKVYKDGIIRYNGAVILWLMNCFLGMNWTHGNSRMIRRITPMLTRYRIYNASNSRFTILVDVGASECEYARYTLHRDAYFSRSEYVDCN